jgi:alkylhydroperoxidase/carboxymuconolactone decarboxylase family protein YurZ
MEDQKKKRARELTKRMAKERGFPRLWRRLLAELDPEFMEITHKGAMYVYHERKALPLKFKEIIVICLDAVTSYEEGFRIHVRNALAAGATQDEILEALELCSQISIHNLSILLPALVEEVKKCGKKGGKSKKHFK